MKKKVISFTSRMVEMVDEIREEKGYMSFSSVVHQAIVDMHKSLFPAYAYPRKDNSPEAKIKRKREEKEAKEADALQEKEHICRELDGEIVEQAGGGKVCKYFTYYHTKKYPQTVPMEMVSVDLVKTQYEPDKKRVMKLIKEGKVKEEPEEKKN